MRYIGSKISIIETIHDLVSNIIPKGSFCDPFAGVGSVGSYFKKRGYNVWSGDLLNFSFFFQIARLKYSEPLSFKKVLSKLGLENRNDLINFLNSIKSQTGWFIKEYSEKRKFFVQENAQKIQACRRMIFSWVKNGWINFDEHAVLLASLINSMDKVANTAGTYYAYLKKWDRKATNEFQFVLVEPVFSKSKGFCFHEPAKFLVKRRHFDILYLDPPFNNRSYAHYYHLPETIALEKTPSVHGMSGIPKTIFSFSEFNKQSDARNALIDMLNNASFKLLVFHYTDNGIITPHEVKGILSSYGKFEDLVIETKGYTTKKIIRRVNHHLYFVHHA